MLQSTSLDDEANILSKDDSHNQARFLAASDPSELACAWLQILLSLNCNLGWQSSEFVVALQLWLEI